jgi:hypothetical protein
LFKEIKILIGIDTKDEEVVGVVVVKIRLRGKP